MEGREAMNTHNNQTPRILVAEEIEGKKVLHDVNSELDTLYVNALKRLSKKKSKEQETEPKTETEFQHEVFVNPEADELAMVEGEAKEWTPTERGVIKFLWIVWGIMTLLAANAVFGEGGWATWPSITSSGFDLFMFCIAIVSIISALVWIPFTIILISLTAGWPILIFWRG